jgi:serine/threonine-protein kinase
VLGVTWSVGQILDGRYRLLALLGQGGMGCVWRAEHTSLGSPAAIKLIHPELASRAGMLARFQREAKAAAKLRGAHVVQILDHGIDDGTPYIAMECLEGESLAQRLAEERALSPAETASIVAGVCAALVAAHRLGIVHRDLKPDNVFLAREETATVVKVLDFGVAKLLDSSAADPTAPTETTTNRTETGAMLGTPRYMSPEQARGRTELDGRSDLWALAVITFECLTGKRPFDADTMGDLILQICSDPIPAPSSVGPVPEGFDAWFAQQPGSSSPRRRTCLFMRRTASSRTSPTSRVLMCPIRTRPRASHRAR